MVNSGKKFVGSVLFPHFVAICVPRKMVKRKKEMEEDKSRERERKGEMILTCG